MVLDLTDFKNVEFAGIISDQTPFYEELAQSQYESWLRSHGIFGNEDVPDDADVDVMVKLCLVQWVYMQVSSDNFNPDALQTFDGDSTLDNPMNVSYEQAERQYIKLFENITKDALLKRNIRSTGMVGKRYRT